MALIDNLISYWKMNEANGNRADSVSTNTAVDVNTVMSGAGKIGLAADFVAANGEYLNAGSAAELDDIALLSWAGWVFIDILDANLRTIVDKRGGGTGWKLQIVDGNGFDIKTLRFFRDWDGVTGVWSADDNAIDTAGWYHVVATYDKGNAANDPIFYVNAVPKFKLGRRPVGNVQTDAAESLLFGAYGAADATKYDGKIDEVGIWDKILSQAEVTELYNGGNGLTWPFIAGAVPMIRWFT